MQTLTGDQLPAIVTAVPGPGSQGLVDILARHECPAVTARRARRADSLGTVNDDPIVWKSAVGANVLDADGNRFVDMTSGFGVSLIGHRHPAVIQAAQRQAEQLVHAMGDAWPDVSRIHLLRELAEIAPGDLSVSILGLSGADAVDCAVKTAILATGRNGVVSFSGGYHGLSIGTVALQHYKESFKTPFRDITHPNVHCLDWACDPSELVKLFTTQSIGLILVEPIQGRGGIRPAPAGWLAAICDIARQHGAVIALDEVQSGVGRSGNWFACEHDNVTPDILCVGKALGGGFPISACIGTPDVMAAWGQSTGEALHTQTFLGHPVGCAAAREVLRLMHDNDTLDAVRRKGNTLRRLAIENGFTTRGRGLMQAVEVPDNAFATTRRMLQRGFICLPAGSDDKAICLTPPVCMTTAQLQGFFETLRELVGVPK